ncbi:hypothetical protein [Simiduia agarivorans]|uniref:Uncharacterized protein n=1 Tax=Simiduia agarivorans (strain DSM 21679 / JCM 13881 / BCRC 17597 / SA1) TaxID=1117647 RepID=R9S678_SIMAS|nr:hypothetical protein [Simiduia agarivorans]AGN11348.1 hypothetical protein M5M_13464 [Simiduia agarivorans SA1 = DSM 21679]
MEPITLTASFATVVSLLGTYKAESRVIEGDEFKDFMQWLIETNHIEIKNLLEVNTKATIGIKALLNQDRELLFQKLGAIDELLSLIASRVDGFSEVSNAIHPNSEISEQAVSILRQFVESEGSKFLKSEAMNRGPVFLIIGGKGGQIDYTEPQFIDDDLNTLVGIGLLAQDYNSKGQPLYGITRAAVKFLATLQ